MMRLIGAYDAQQPISGTRSGRSVLVRAPETGRNLLMLLNVIVVASLYYLFARAALSAHLVTPILLTLGA